MSLLTRPTRGQCLVCSGESIGINFGVPTCMPCKAFFRRNAVRLGNYEYTCPLDGDCVITHKYRRLCKCCRLAKCFRVGMRKDLILSENEKHERRQIIERNRLKREQEQSTNTCQTLIRPTNLLRYGASRFRNLSSSDQTLLTNITAAYDKTCIAGQKIYGEYFPSKHHTNLLPFFGEYNNRHMTLIEYFKLIPEFARISIDDRICLLRNNFGIMLSLNESMNIPDDEDPKIIVTFKTVFGYDLGLRLYDCMNVIRAYRCDPILTRLVLIIQTLSSGLSRYQNSCDSQRIYNNGLEIFRSQCFYIKLLWKYVRSRSLSEKDVTRFFSKLIRDLLQLVQVSSATDAYVISFSGEIDQMDPLIRSILLA